MKGSDISIDIVLPDVSRNYRADTIKSHIGGTGVTFEELLITIIFSFEISVYAILEAIRVAHNPKLREAFSVVPAYMQSRDSVFEERLVYCSVQRVP